MKKQLLAWCLVIAVILGLAPMNVLASDKAREPQIIESQPKMSAGGESSAIWNGSIASGFAGGTGTEDDPYIIRTAEELAYFASSVNSGATYEGRYIKLEKNIILNDTADWENWVETAPANSWTAIGIIIENIGSITVNSFKGTFDGNDHTVSGIYIDNTGSNQGLFGVVDSGYIKNLGVKESYINGYEYIGGVVGRNNGTITACYNVGTISGFEVVGGICASNSGDLNDCNNSGTISGSEIVGGICGSTSGDLNNCNNSGKISGEKFIKDINGVYRKMTGPGDNNGTIRNSFFVGGVSGDNSGYITNCSDNGTVSGDDHIGGVSGYNYGHIANCSNNGTVSGINNVGGVSGDNSGYITDCSDNGTVSGSNCVGGLNGCNEGTVTVCRSNGKITGNNYVGGVSGYSYGYVTDCYNTGMVSGSDYVGGLVGITDASRGFGYVITGYNIGEINGSNYVGGIGGVLCNEPENCYYLDVCLTNPTNTEGKALTSGQMKQKSSFVNWNFDNIWNLDPAVNDGYPNHLYYKEDNSASDIWDGSIASGFAGGTGTIYDPYIIKTAEQLAYLASMVNSGTDYHDKHIKLANDIVLNDTADWENWAEAAPANSWTPIGTAFYEKEDRYYYLIERVFRGTFDGDGHTVSGIYINSSEDYLGLFGYTAYEAVQNLGIEKSYIKGNQYVGGVIGSGSAKNCYNAGTVIGSNLRVGGVIGSGSAKNCYNTGTVSCSVPSAGSVGGVVGEGSAEKCFNTGTVSGELHTEDPFPWLYIGGVVGYSQNNYISMCYNTGTVIGIGNGYSVGGVVGRQADGGFIEDCFNTGTVSGNGTNNPVGGVVGYCNSTSVKNCYNTGAVNGSGNYIGGIAGDRYGTVTTCYYLDKLMDDLTNTYGAVLSGEQMKQQESYIGWDFERVWNIQPDINNGYPTLRDLPTPELQPEKPEEPEEPDVPEEPEIREGIWNGKAADGFAGGTGTENDPYVIETAEQLAFLAESTNAGLFYAGEYFDLVSDIVLNDTSDWENWAEKSPTNTWTPIGFNKNNISGAVFSGIFNGNGHTVSGIYINNTDENQGLFGRVSDGKIYNLGIEKSYIKGESEVGGVAGAVDYTSVTDCWNSGTVIANRTRVGGVVGYLFGYDYRAAVLSCRNTGEVSGLQYVGGIVGYNDSGTIDRCCNSGTVRAGSADFVHLGGVVGASTRGSVSFCYNTATVSGEGNYVGGVIGDIVSGTVSKCYNTGSVSGSRSVGGICGYVYGYDSDAVIADCYNMGAVSGSERFIGGIAGMGPNSRFGVVTNCYNAGKVSGTGGGGVLGITTIGTTRCYYLNTCVTEFSSTGTRLTDAQMKQKESFEGWDFENVWEIQPDKNKGYPILRAIPPQGASIKVYGDATGDGEIDGLDVVRMKKYLANLDYDTGMSTNEISAYADANGDGVIDGLDVVRLKKYLANYDYETGTSTITLGPQ